MIHPHSIKRGLGLVLTALLVFINNLQAAPLRILPLGDSLTVGYTDPPTWKVPYTFGYRGPLYILLTDAGYNFQYVGASGEPWCQPFGPSFGLPAAIMSPDLRRLNQDCHRGYGGIKVSQLLKGEPVPGSNRPTPNIASILNADNPDIILLMAGTNGIPDAMQNLDPLVRQIVTIKPAAHLIIAQITPRREFQQDIYDYNRYIATVLVPKYAALGKSITMVNQYPNLLTSPGNPRSIDTSLYTDDAHLKPTAYSRMAKTWFKGIEAVAPPHP